MIPPPVRLTVGQILNGVISPVDIEPVDEKKIDSGAEEDPEEKEGERSQKIKRVILLFQDPSGSIFNQEPETLDEVKTHGIKTSSVMADSNRVR